MSFIKSAVFAGVAQREIMCCIAEHIEDEFKNQEYLCDLLGINPATECNDAGDLIFPLEIPTKDHIFMTYTERLAEQGVRGNCTEMYVYPASVVTELPTSGSAVLRDEEFYVLIRQQGFTVDESFMFCGRCPTNDEILTLGAHCYHAMIETILFREFCNREVKGGGSFEEARFKDSFAPPPLLSDRETAVMFSRTRWAIGAYVTRECC